MLHFVKAVLGSGPERWHHPVMSITATVENDTIKLPPGVHVPDGTPARVFFDMVAEKTLAERYAGLIGITDALPEDLAENHDHYLHGAPKRR
jgi:hypothetical protein